MAEPRVNTAVERAVVDFPAFPLLDGEPVLLSRLAGPFHVVASCHAHGDTEYIIPFEAVIGDPRAHRRISDLLEHSPEAETLAEGIAWLNFIRSLIKVPSGHLRYGPIRKGRP